MKINKNIAFLSVIFVMPFVLSACGSVKKNNNISTKTNIQMNGESHEKEILVPDDRIEFSDPGDDEIGREIKEMDDLLNQTSPSEYSEEDLSEEAIEGEFELE